MKCMMKLMSVVHTPPHPNKVAGAPPGAISCYQSTWMGVGYERRVKSLSFDFPKPVKA